MFYISNHVADSTKHLLPHPIYHIKVTNHCNNNIIKFESMKEKSTNAKDKLKRRDKEAKYHMRLYWSLDI